MELNYIIFPAPKSTYNEDLDGLIWIPNKDKNIPCTYYEYMDGSDKILLFFHGNAEDIGSASQFAKFLCYQFKINVLSIEYPSYGIYKGTVNENEVLSDAEYIYDYICAILKYEEKNIFIFGRSIGSGPATHLSSQNSPGMLILMSAFTCIKEVAQHLCGKAAAILLADRFSNIEKIQNVECPTIFIHGEKDNIIPYTHSVSLLSNARGIAYLHQSPNMTHNEYNIHYDIIDPITKFLKQSKIQIKTGKEFSDKMPLKLYANPTKYQENKNQEMSIFQDVKQKLLMYLSQFCQNTQNL